MLEFADDHNFFHYMPRESFARLFHIAFRIMTRMVILSDSLIAPIASDYSSLLLPAFDFSII